MSKANFVENGWVGCPVHCQQYGNGVIVDIQEDSDWPIKVTFQKNERMSYSFSKTGIEYAGCPPTLCYGHKESFAIDQGVPPMSFPAYYKAKTSGAIVLFTAARCGTVVAADGVWPVGKQSETWVECTNVDYWTPCDKPELEPKLLEFKGTPVWAIVADYPDDWDTGVKRRVVAYGEGWYYVVADGNDEFNADTIIQYQYAWEIPEGERE